MLIIIIILTIIIHTIGINPFDCFVSQPSITSVSRSAVAFHHVTAEHMYNMEFFIYHLIPHGLRRPSEESL